MKQFLTIFLLLIYSFSSVGATVSAHLCAGKVQKCFCGKSNKKDNCCAKTNSFVKKQDDHQSVASSVVKPVLLIAAAPVIYNVEVVAPIVASTTSSAIHSKKGLLFTGPPIYILDCLYLI